MDSSAAAQDATAKLRPKRIVGTLPDVNESQASGDDEKWMREAILQARRGLGRTSPNPAVGAVIVRNGRALATGFHRAAGEPHAEIEAIHALADPHEAKNAALYVTLEPCSTTGRTPPCTDAVIACGFARVVYGAADPNPKHAGRASGILRAAGIEASSGVLEEECTRLNEAWNHWIRTGRPFVIAKWGMSIDGRIGSPPGRRWITSESARADAMQLRSLVDAILVGGGTVRADDPSLTVRGVPCPRQPWRAVWSKTGDLPKEARIFTDQHRRRTLVYKGVPLASVLDDLGKRGITSLLVEGGGTVLGEAFDNRLVNKVQCYIAPELLGGAVPAVAGTGAARNEEGSLLESIEYARIGDTIRITGYPASGAPSQ